MSRNLNDAVRERKQRSERGRSEGESSFAQNLAMIGVLGWTIVVPTLIGVAAGRWLDRMLGTGIMLTSALLLIGLVVGCTLAWRRVRT